eukprot:1152084-Pelagomonas_calceolata.AAC.4
MLRQQESKCCDSKRASAATAKGQMLRQQEIKCCDSMRANASKNTLACTSVCVIIPPFSWTG